MRKYILILFFVITLTVNHFYGPLLYAKISGQEQKYNIGKLCQFSRQECENTYFKDYLNKISSLQVGSRQFFSNIIIKNDQIGYVGNCPCPYNSDSRGGSCGGRSSYSKDGQISHCYDSNVSDNQISTLKTSMIVRAENELIYAVQNVISIYHGYITYIIVIVFYSVLYIYFRNNKVLV